MLRGEGNYCCITTNYNVVIHLIIYTVSFLCSFDPYFNMEEILTIYDNKIKNTEGDDKVLSESLCSFKQISKSFLSLKKPSGHRTFNGSVGSIVYMH